MISWDHPNLLTLSFSAYKRRGVLVEEQHYFMKIMPPRRDTS
jgi:hypothetical protein